MNLLVDLPPKAVKIGDTEYDINSDFRVSVLFEMLMQDDEVTDEMKVWKAIELYFPVIPESEDLVDILNAISWFYRCGRMEKEQYMTDDGGEGAGDRPSYSFDYDDEYIYSAFRQQYGINLVSVKYLHWWEFRAMFKGLDECAFVRIMDYRSRKITADMSKTEKEFIRRMQRVHSLPRSRKEREKESALADALINGKPLDGLLDFE